MSPNPQPPPVPDPTTPPVEEPPHPPPKPQPQPGDPVPVGIVDPRTNRQMPELMQPPTELEVTPLSGPTEACEETPSPDDVDEKLDT